MTKWNLVTDEAEPIPKLTGQDNEIIMWIQGYEDKLMNAGFQPQYDFGYYDSYFEKFCDRSGEFVTPAAWCEIKGTLEPPF